MTAAATANLLVDAARPGMPVTCRRAWPRRSQVSATRRVSITVNRFPWLAYPIFGLSLAGFAARPTSAERLMRTWARTGPAVPLARGTVALLAPDTDGILVVGDCYRSGLSTQVPMPGFVFVWLATRGG